VKNQFMIVSDDNFKKRHFARLGQKRFELKLPRDASRGILSFFRIGTQWMSLSGMDGAASFFADRLENTDHNTKLLSVPAFEGAFVEMAATTHFLLFSVDPPTPNEFGKVVAIHRSGNGLERCGAQKPLAVDWQKSTPQEWSVRIPRFITAAEHGFLITDRTPHLFSESPVISYFSPTERLFYRVAIPAQDVGGLFIAQGAVIISKPLAGEIRVYTPKSQDILRKEGMQ
jgi:hypothetical protein